MNFKPTTYLASFAGFVILFMGLGGYVGYVKITEHLLIISYLDGCAALPSIQPCCRRPSGPEPAERVIEGSIPWPCG